MPEPIPPGLRPPMRDAPNRAFLWVVVLLGALTGVGLAVALFGGH